MLNKHLTETELEDYANEQAEALYAQDTMGIHDDEMEDLSIDGFFNDYDGDFYDES